MPTENLVEITDLAFSYGQREIYNGLNLVIPRGRVVGIMGASGSGKTTLLRLIGGQLRPARGEIRVMGQNVHALTRAELFELRRRMGMQFQQGGLFTDLSVFDNIAFQMREQTDLPEDMVNDLVLMKLHAVGLRGAATLMPAELSGGMARRVGLARAIALDPSLSMYDEPFAGLDPISCNVIGNLIRKLNDTLGLTSILVSYDAHEALKVIDYVYFLADGKVVAEGTTEDVKTSSDPFVSQFIRALAFTPDGTGLLSGSADGLAILWDAATGRELETVSQSARGVLSARLSSDGSLLFLSRVSGAVEVWDRAARRKIKGLPGHTDAVTGLAVTLVFESLSYFRLFSFPAGITISGLSLVLSLLVFFGVSWLTRSRASRQLPEDVRLIMRA